MATIGKHRYGIRLTGKAKIEKLLKEENLTAVAGSENDRKADKGQGANGSGEGMSDADFAGMNEHMKLGFLAMKDHQAGKDVGGRTGPPKGAIQLLEELEHMVGKGGGKAGNAGMEEMMAGLMGMVGGNVEEMMAERRHGRNDGRNDGMMGSLGGKRVDDGCPSQ